MPAERHSSVKQIANRYSVHEKTIWRWARNGQFPKPVRLTAGCVRWRESDLAEWEARREVAE